MQKIAKVPVPALHRLAFLLLSMAMLMMLAQCDPTSGSVPFVHESLPYAMDALEPVISARTLALHHGKHHKGYVQRAKQLAGGGRFRGQTAEEIIKAAAGSKPLGDLFNNAAQAWNHAFFWKSMTPQGGGDPTGEIAVWIEKSFGSYASFRKRLLSVAAAHFGSGWVWLIAADDRLQVVTTDNADTPLAHDQKPLFTIDLWEHAYYLDYQNRRKEYVAAVIDKLIDWDFVNAQLPQHAISDDTAVNGSQVSG